MMVVAGALAMLVACGGQVERAPAPLFGSGSRLVASYWETPGGVRVFSTWYDTKLDTSCSFQNAEDGVLRCLPSGLSAATPSDDATITSGVCGSPPLAAPPPWVRVGACQGGRLVLVGGVVDDCAADSSPRTTGCAVYRTGTLISQNPTTLPGLPGVSGIEEHFALGEHLSPTDFVAARVHDEPVGAHLGQRRYIAEDDAWQVVGIVDTTKTGEAALCAPTAIGTRMLSCVHADLLTSDDGKVFADASCSDEVAQTCSDARPSLGERLVRDEATCSFSYELFTVGPEVAVSEVYAGASTSTCSSFVSAPTGHFYRVGSTVAPDPAVDVVVRAVGSGRVQPEFYALPDGTLLERSAALAMHDTQRGSECSLAFGVPREETMPCIPEPLGQVFPATKAGCPELVATPSGACAAQPSRPVIAVRGPPATDPCTQLRPPPVEYDEVGAESTPSADCTPSGAQGPFYAVGVRIDPASFATVKYAKDTPR